MPFTPETIAVKPYNQCIKCDHLGTKCDGPNVIAMSKDRYCEWCRQLKEERGWSNAKLAEVSGVSKATIDKMMTNRITGFNGETISSVTCALVYGYASPEGNWGKFPCAMVAPEVPADGCPKCEEIKKQMELQAHNDRAKIDFLKQQVEFKENQMVSKDKLLDERVEFLRQKDRTVALLASLLGFAALLIFSALLVDVLNPNVGFFWLEKMAAVSGFG